MEESLKIHIGDYMAEQGQRLWADGETYVIKHASISGAFVLVEIEIQKEVSRQAAINNLAQAMVSGLPVGDVVEWAMQYGYKPSANPTMQELFAWATSL